MTYVFIDAEVVRAIGLSLIFMSVMITIITLGIIFLIHKISKGKVKSHLEMAGLLLAWAVFIFLNENAPTSTNYNPVFFAYSLTHLISIILGAITIIIFLFLFSKFLKVYDRRLLIAAGIFAVSGLLMRIIFPFLLNIYLELLQRVTIIIPILLGFFMIIKSYIRGRD